ncbi:MAG TPA: AraC family transcriptional regulator [Saprospiraceae bacterium]|nr:AraC family transcriptional regulator [Saprospiraceae bacterium]
MNIYREITPLNDQDVFVLLDSHSNGFDYPIHCHPEYELNLILGISGVRLIGDSTERYHEQDLVLIGPYLYHKWTGDEYINGLKKQYNVITLQFSIDLLEGTLFKKEKFHNIRKMLDASVRGIKFSGKDLNAAAQIITSMTQDKGFTNVIEFIQLLETLSQASDFCYLASEGFMPQTMRWDSKRIQTAYNYIIRHFDKSKLKVEEVAKLINMSDSSFSHYFKKYTNKSFTEFLTDVRIGNACKLLIGSDDTISSIAYASGFNNIANFNRLFKKTRLCTPVEFRNRHKEHSGFDWQNQITPWQFLPPHSRDLPSIGPKEYSTKLTHV